MKLMKCIFCVAKNFAIIVFAGFNFTFAEHLLLLTRLYANEAINFKHFNLKVTGDTTKGRIVECLALFTLSKANVLVHPNCVAVTKKLKFIRLNLFKRNIF